jgi:hypothetical protein
MRIDTRVIVLDGLTVRRAFTRCGGPVGRHVFGVFTVLLIGSIVWSARGLPVVRSRLSRRRRLCGATRGVWTFR